MTKDKTNCPVCPSSDAYHIYADHGHCYSCGHHEWFDKSMVPLKSLGKDQKQEVWLPKDYDNNWIPEVGAKWLWDQRLTALDITKAKIGWSTQLESLIFPIFGKPYPSLGHGTEQLLLWQARYCGHDEKIPKWRTFGPKSKVIHLHRVWTHGTIVVVEDIVSAIACSKITNSMPLFGSSLDQERAFRISRDYKTVKIWLDPDKKVQSVQMALQLQELGLKADVIMSDHDPKWYKTADVRQFIGVNEK